MAYRKRTKDGASEAPTASEKPTRTPPPEGAFALERRFHRSSIEIREDGGVRHIRGHAAVFNVVSEDMGFRERIAPGAFAEALNRDDVRALWNHDPNYVLGRNRAGTLKLWEDERGLAYDIVPPPTTWARDLLVSIERGDVSQSSFGFQTEVQEWDLSGDEDVRTLKKVRLFDVSPVTFPAYPQTDTSVRAMAGVDLEALTSACGRIEAGTPRAGDLDLVRAAHRGLAKYLTPDGADTIAIMRRRLDLATREL